MALLKLTYRICLLTFTQLLSLTLTCIQAMVWTPSFLSPFHFMYGDLLLLGNLPLLEHAQLHEHVPSLILLRHHLWKQANHVLTHQSTDPITQTIF